MDNYEKLIDIGKKSEKKTSGVKRKNKSGSESSKRIYRTHRTKNASKDSSSPSESNNDNKMKKKQIKRKKKISKSRSQKSRKTSSNNRKHPTLVVQDCNRTLNVNKMADPQFKPQASQSFSR